MIHALIGLGILMIGSGLFNTFIALRLEMEGYKPEVIGAVTAALYLGILVGSFRIHRLIERLGHIRSFTLFTIFLTAIALSQALLVEAWYWGTLRFFGGIAIAGVFIVIESWLLMASAPDRRGVVLSLYLTIFYAALSLGQILFNFVELASLLPYFLVAALTLLSTLPLFFHKGGAPKAEKGAKPLAFTTLWQMSSLGVLGSAFGGGILACIHGLTPIYAKEIGLTQTEIGTLMALVIFGGLSLQWPLGWWADKTCRRRILALTSLLAMGSALAAALTGSFLAIWLFGGFAFAIYPLSMAYTCESVGKEQIVAATGGLVFFYGIGSIFGPLLAPIAMLSFGPEGFFYFLAATSLLLACLSLTKKKAIAEETIDP